MCGWGLHQHWWILQVRMSDGLRPRQIWSSLYWFVNTVYIYFFNLAILIFWWGIVFTLFPCITNIILMQICYSVLTRIDLLTCDVQLWPAATTGGSTVMFVLVTVKIHTFTCKYLVTYTLQQVSKNAYIHIVFWTFLKTIVCNAMAMRHLSYCICTIINRCKFPIWLFLKFVERREILTMQFVKD